MIIDPEILKPLSSSDISRFEFAMETLQLKPFVHFLQFLPNFGPFKTPPPRLSAEDEEKYRKSTSLATAFQVVSPSADHCTVELEESDWPKLVVLASGSDFYPMW